jgi:hypothetical protein
VHGRVRVVAVVALDQEAAVVVPVAVAVLIDAAVAVVVAATVLRAVAPRVEAPRVPRRVAVVAVRAGDPAVAVGVGAVQAVAVGVAPIAGLIRDGR